MSDLLLVLAYALLPGVGNMAGGLLAERTDAPRWLVGTALHAAAGIAIALISVDLMPRILPSVPRWGVVLAFLIGAGVSVALSRGVRAVRRHKAVGGAKGASTKAWMVYAAIGADLVSDGLVTGAGSAVALDLGFLLAAAQLIANVPGGYAANANLKHEGARRRTRLLGLGGMFLPVLVSALLGFLLLQGRPEMVQNAVLAGIVGLLLLATIEDVVPEGDEPGPPRWGSTLGFSLGFAGFALIAGYAG
ncbi:ZIP family metal transporter [Parvularcula dongshanensis]|uniref:ZIP family zinc transporter n=1 Tax=Parvularcula dongshanensis TaxID=1173995 RepID=A0A840I8C6_9PROT|nr:hypothetical protein [Parvularcula dongshanensis]MBB4660358.1 ZIP family zinc transporter [Parvularcula dongshanensis]